jgi:hypothetical protein
MIDEKLLSEHQITLGICSYCFPNHSDELMTQADFHTKNGHWKGGYTEEKYFKFKSFRKEFEKDRLKNVVEINPDYGICLCKDHLLGLIQMIEKTEKEQLVDSCFSIL